MLLHGATLNGRMWNPAVSILSPEFTALTPDLPGHGTGRDGPFSIDRAVAQVAALIERESPAGAVVAGDSLGGCTAMALAAAHPALVRGLVLAGCTAEFTGLFASMARASARLMGAMTKVFGPERVPKPGRGLRSMPSSAAVASGSKRGGKPCSSCLGGNSSSPWLVTRGRSCSSTEKRIAPTGRGSPDFSRPFPEQS